MQTTLTYSTLPSFEGMRMCNSTIITFERGMTIPKPWIHPAGSPWDVGPAGEISNSHMFKHGWLEQPGISRVVDSSVDAASRLKFAAVGDERSLGS